MAEEALPRRSAVRTLLAARGDGLAISGLGSATWDLASLGDHPGNFYLWGAMGGAAALGLGLALAQPARPVLVVTGDGEMLMGLGSLASLAARAPENLSIVVLDNGRYGETGMQESHTALATDLAAVAQAAGFRESFTLSQQAELEDLSQRVWRPEGLLFAVLKIEVEDPPRVLPEKDAVLLKTRFRSHLGLEPR